MPKVQHTASHDTRHTLYQHEISSDRNRSRQTFVYMLHTECKQLKTSAWNISFKKFLNLQYCDFMLVNLVHFGILIF